MISKEKLKETIWENVKSLLIVLIAVFFIRSFVAEATVVPTGSMEKTILIGDHLFLSKLPYGPKIPFTDLKLPTMKDIKRGDIVAFRFPLDPSLTYVKRVIGLPGDVIEVRMKHVYVNGAKLHEPYVVHTDGQTYSNQDFLPSDARRRDNMGPVKVPDDSLFVMGDNRDSSYDSRFWGFVPKRNVVGQPLIIYWSYDAPTQDWVGQGIWNRVKFYSSVAVNFFTKTRWSRTGKTF